MTFACIDSFDFNVVRSCRIPADPTVYIFLQGKLVKLFSRQLVTKQKCGEDWNHCEKLRYYPRLEQWLQVVGINEEAIKVRIANYIHVIKIFEM